MPVQYTRLYRRTDVNNADLFQSPRIRRLGIESLQLAVSIANILLHFQVEDRCHTFDLHIKKMLKESLKSRTSGNEYYRNHLQNNIPRQHQIADFRVFYPSVLAVRRTNAKLLRDMSHICTCIARGTNDRNGRLIIKCDNCSTEYHDDRNCIPSGSIVREFNKILCPCCDGSTRSRKCKDKRKLDICVHCFKKERHPEILKCCKTCPKAIHIECLENAANILDWQCKSCQNGFLPAMNDTVFAKRKATWWPAEVVPDDNNNNRRPSRRDGPPNIRLRFLTTNNNVESVEFHLYSNVFSYEYEQQTNAVRMIEAITRRTRNRELRTVMETARDYFVNPRVRID